MRRLSTVVVAFVTMAAFAQDEGCEDGCGHPFCMRMIATDSKAARDGSGRMEGGPCHAPSR